MSGTAADAPSALDASTAARRFRLPDTVARHARPRDPVDVVLPRGLGQTADTAAIGHRFDREIPVVLDHNLHLWREISTSRNGDRARPRDRRPKGPICPRTVECPEGHLTKYSIRAGVMGEIR
jgi:hypothetical protein